MRIPYKLSTVLRVSLYLLITWIPSLFQPELFRPWNLPLAAVLGIALGEISHRLRIKTPPALLFLTLGTVAVFRLLRLCALFLGDTPFTDWYAAFSLISVPFYVVLSISCFSTRLYRGNPSWRPAEPLILLIFLAIGFWNQGNYRLGVFDHPLKAAAFVLAAVLIALAALLVSLPHRRRRIAGFLAVLPLFLTIGYLGVRNFSAQSVSANGGLIQPTLFRFDFSPYLSLQSEITLNDRLVLIAHVPEEYSVALLKRMSLSGWDPEKGFYEHSPPGGSPQELTVPAAPLALADPGFQLRNTVRQEYFIVNFDPRSLISMDYPISIEPYKIWKTESFNGAYAVTSRVTGFIPFELYDSPGPEPRGTGELNGDAFDFYTAIDPETASYIEPLARELTEGIEGYYDRISAMNLWLLGDTFRYSLHPGSAEDGNQLRYFLTETRKGYCTYYAFSLALMCRSIGIPARVAAGFFIAPDTGALDYYPIRSNMAHAWVEVFFPSYGWIAFDPTNQNPAEGEPLQFDFSPRGDEFMGLLNEIIERKGELQVAEGDSGPDEETRTPLSIIRAYLKKAGWKFLLFLLIVPLGAALRSLCLNWLLGHSKNPRTVALFAERHAANRTKNKALSPRQEVLLGQIRVLANKARFSSRFSTSDADECRRALYLLLRELRASAKNAKGKKKKSINLLLALSLSAVSLIGTGYAEAQELVPGTVIEEDLRAQAAADQLLERANRAISAENWETATNLLMDGKTRFPKNPVFPYTLGDLFLEQSLYPAAIRELEQALSLGISKPEVYLKLSDATGYENQDEQSLLWLRRYVSEVPDNLSAWASFGWLCYKTHRFAEGISTLNRVIETWGPDGNIYVGLGNLYSALYDYENAKNRYTRAIELAKEKNQQYLASVYYYNRSILEESFYRFDDSYDDATLSLEASPRASGYLMQAELELRKLDYSAAAERYVKAQSLDSTPLATIGLTETLLKAGHLEKAYLHLQAVKDNADQSWIANYGTTPLQFHSDIYRLERDYWRFMKHRELRRVMHSLSTEIQRSTRVMYYGLKEWLYEARFRTSTLKIAQTYNVDNKPENLHNGQGLYYHSFKYIGLDRWPELAHGHLKSAESIETTHIALAQPSYYYEWGALQKDKTKLDEALQTLDPLWEREILAEALAKRIQIAKNRNSSLFLNLTRNLYQIDPARFLKEQITLPVRFSIDSRLNKKVAYRLQKALKRAGFSSNQKSSMELSIILNPEGIRISLENEHGNFTGFPQVIHNSNPSAQVIAESVNKFSTELFHSNIDK